MIYEFTRCPEQKKGYQSRLTRFPPSTKIASALPFTRDTHTHTHTRTNTQHHVCELLHTDTEEEQNELLVKLFFDQKTN